MIQIIGIMVDLTKIVNSHMGAANNVPTLFERIEGRNKKQQLSKFGYSIGPVGHTFKIFQKIELPTMYLTNWSERQKRLCILTLFSLKGNDNSHD
jgi:hypothetical protein